MTFLTSQEYENFNYRFFIEDDNTFVVKIFLEDKHIKTRFHKDKNEILEKYLKHFPEIERYI